MGVALDLPHNVERGRTWLDQQAAPEEGTASDQLYAHAAWLLDYGLSYDVVLDLLEAHSPGYERDDIATRVYNATKHQQNEVGAHAGQGMMVAALEAWSTAHPELAATPEPEPLKMPVRGWLDIRDAVYDKPWWWWQDRCVGADANLYTGREKAGKTTLVENLAVAIAGGADLLGKSTRQGSVFLLVGEDRYGEVRDNIIAISKSLQVSDDALAKHLSFFSVRSDRVKESHRLAEIDDSGNVSHSRFLAEVVMPHLISLPKPCLWIIDPIAVFFNFNRYSDIPARAMVDGFLNEIVAMGVTPLLTDHPSVSSTENGRNVAGSVQFSSAFPLVATLKAGKWEGLTSVQRTMSFELMASRHAPENDGSCEFYRLRNTPAFSMAAAVGHGRRDHMMTVYRYVIEGLARPAPLYCWSNNRGASVIKHGPEEIAHWVGLDEATVATTIAQCLSESWLEESERDKAGSANVPAHLKPGSAAPKLDRPAAPDARDGAAGETW